MKRLSLALVAISVAAAAVAAEAPAVKPTPTQEKLSALIRDNIDVCAVDVDVSEEPSPKKLPANMTGTLVQVKSDRQQCNEQLLAVLSTEGGFFLGIPWFLDQRTEQTLEDKIKGFTWEAMQQNFTPIIKREKTRDGLYPVQLVQQTERGKLVMEGEIDPAGTILFIGHFRAAKDVANERLKAFGPLLASMPVTGPANAPVTVIEFSDFECPSCKHASHYMPDLLAKHKDGVRYIRYDLPLVTTHPWALTAAIAGRAIYKQKPDLFWTYKKQIYDNQDQLSAFTIDDFTRGFAQDHELDMKQYDADVASVAIRDELLKGAGLAFSNDIRSTPTYMVNGVVVDPGNEGAALEKVVSTILAKKTASK